MTEEFPPYPRDRYIKGDWRHALFHDKDGGHQVPEWIDKHMVDRSHSAAPTVWFTLGDVPCSPFHITAVVGHPKASWREDQGALRYEISVHPEREECAPHHTVASLSTDNLAEAADFIRIWAARTGLAVPPPLSSTEMNPAARDLKRRLMR